MASEITLEEKINAVANYLPYSRMAIRQVLQVDLRNRAELGFPKEKHYLCRKDENSRKK